MARPVWSGAISFGLVQIPVKLYPAVSSRTVAFHQLDSKTKSRIKQLRVSAETGEEVPYTQIVKGYELSSGEYVEVSEEELSALDPKAAKTIDLDEFVDLVDIDPIFFDKAYYLAPDKAPKPYALLVQAMEESGKVGIAHFVMRTKQYLAAIRATDGVLVLSTMVYADEVNDPTLIADIGDAVAMEVSDKELTMARQLVDSLSAEFDPAKFRDTYREAVVGLIEAKAAGNEIVAPKVEEEQAVVVDLMAALEASVSAAKEARKRHPTGREDEAEAEAAEAESVADVEPTPANKVAAKKGSPRKAAAKKTAAKKTAAKAPAKKATTKKAPIRAERVMKSA
ncbi:MAG TPA: Ku protein [Acidimicrobiales bacterium]